MRTLILVLMILLSAVTKAQVARDSAYYESLVKQADKVSSYQLDSALVLYQQIVKETEKTRYQQLNWEAKMRAGLTYSNLGQKDSALFILQNTYREIVAQQDTIYQQKALIYLADYYSDNYEFEPAISHLLDAQKLMTNSTPFSIRFCILNTLGASHKKMKDFTSALKYYGQLENDYFSQLSDLDKYIVFMHTGNVYLEMKDYAKAEELYLKAYAEVQKIDDQRRLALITYNLGNLYYKQKKTNKSLEFTGKALTSYTAIGDRYYIEFCNRLLGAIQKRLHNFHGAESYYLKALRIAKEIKNPNSILANYHNLSLNYSAWAKETSDTQKYDEALKYNDLWTEMKDSLYQENLANQLLELEKKYETEKKNAQIDLLGKENQLKADELLMERQNRKFMLVVIGSLVFIMAVVVYFMVYYRRVNEQLKSQSQIILEQKDYITSQNVQLQKAVDTQNKLFGIIAHDLRSPLVSISNFVQLLNFYLRDGSYDSITRMAADMDRKNKHVLELTDNLLNWARSQSGGLRPQIKQTGLREILDQCYRLYLPVAERKNITLELENGDDCQIWTDRDMVRTICRNLINNALKFTPQEGTVRISYSCNDKKARISVSDTGMGISPDQQKRLFNIGKEDVRYGTDGEKSSGLGLMVCKEFCDILNGSVVVKSTEGVGSMFTFTIPTHTEDSEELSRLKEKEQGERTY